MVHFAQGVLGAQTCNLVTEISPPPQHDEELSCNPWAGAVILFVPALSASTVLSAPRCACKLDA